MRLGMLLAVAVLIAACGRPLATPSAGESGGDMMPSPDGSSGFSNYEAFTDAVRNLFCQRQVDCGFADGAYEQRCVAELGIGSGAIDAHSASPNVTFNPTAASTCFESIKSTLADCHYASFGLLNKLALNDLMLTTACKAVVTGTSPEGSPCPNQIECAPGTYCLVQYSSTGSCSSVCKAFQPIGAPCGNITKRCGTDAFCDDSTMTCVERRGDGGYCPIVEACKDGLACLGNGGLPPVCRPIGGPGAPCSVPNGCQEGLVCSPTTIPDNGMYACRAPAGPGAPCTQNNGHADCAAGLVCIGGACAPGMKLGEACGSSYQCAERLVCSYPPASNTQSGTCQPAIAKGGSCNPGAVCQAPHVCLSGVCTPPSESGGQCFWISSDETMCASGYCRFPSTLTDGGVCMPRIGEGGACIPGQGTSPCQGNLLCDPDTSTCRTCGAPG